jgi:hypothetical protein
MMTRRACLSTLTAAVLGATRAPGAQLKPSGYTIVNGGEHAWVLKDSRFPIRPEYAICPNSLPKHEYSAESILEADAEKWGRQDRDYSRLLLRSR